MNATTRPSRLEMHHVHDVRDAAVEAPHKDALGQGRDANVAVQTCVAVIKNHRNTRAMRNTPWKPLLQ